jgi:Flp pilus assembly protein protease CpaA
VAAAAIDYRTLRIPNALTFPFILLGIALIPPRCAIPLAGLICAVSYSFVYVLWKCGLWGGGDAKLVLALFILISPAYPPLSFIVAFSLCLALVLFAKHLLIGRGAGPMGPALLLAYVLSIAAMEAVP